MRTVSMPDDAFRQSDSVAERERESERTNTPVWFFDEIRLEQFFRKCSAAPFAEQKKKKKKVWLRNAVVSMFQLARSLT